MACSLVRGAQRCLSSSHSKSQLMWGAEGFLQRKGGGSSKRNIWYRGSKSKNYKIVKPGIVSEQISPMQFPRPVPLPPYAHTQVVPPFNENAPIDIKSEEDIIKMRQSCRLARQILLQAGEMLRVGVTTDQIDQLVFDMAMAHNAYPSPLNYKGFPKSVCTSVNNVACHGIPDDRPLADGDIINIDVTVYLDGFHGDCSETFMVGDVDDAGQRLVKITDECLTLGLDACGPGRYFHNIGEAIYRHAWKNGFNIVSSFTGHGIGSYFHGPPDVYHVPNPWYPPIMEPGMTFTVEPIVSEGSEKLIILEDGWTAISADNSRSAQAEHTVLITDTGIDILTI